MLQIYIHGARENGFLDLPPDSRLDLEELQSAFDEDLSTGEFSLPLDVTWTDNNRRLLSFAERVQNFNRVENFWICTVYNQGFPELIRAKFTILGKLGKFNYRNGKFSASVSGGKGLFSSSIKNKKLTDLYLGGVIEWAGMDSRQFAYSHATGGQPHVTQIAFAPVAIEQFFQENRKDFAGEFLAKDTVNTVVITGTGVNDWVFGRPSPTNESIALASGIDGYEDYRTVPFFKTQFVVKRCFSENGFNVTGDFIDDPAFTDLVVFNQCGIENLAYSVNIDFNRKIIPANHVPDVLIADWLRDFFSLTSMYPIFSDNNNVQLVYHKTDISTRKIANLDDEITGDFESEYLDGDAVDKGYKINFVWDDADQYFSERVKDLSDKNMVATVATVTDLLTLTIGRTFTTDDIVFVQSENIYYQVADATSSPVKYDAFSEGLDEYQQDEGEKSIDVKMSTLCQYVELNPSTALYERRNYLGCRQTGTYINKVGALVKNKFGNRVFYIGRRLVGSVNVPVSYNHNRNAANDIICPYSLTIKGVGGLAENFHIPWLNITENAELLKVQARSSERVLQKLRNYNRFQIAGTLFMLQQIERSIPAADVIKLQVVAL